MVSFDKHGSESSIFNSQRGTVLTEIAMLSDDHRQVKIIAHSLPYLLASVARILSICLIVNKIL